MNSRRCTLRKPKAQANIDPEGVVPRRTPCPKFSPWRGLSIFSLLFVGSTYGYSPCPASRDLHTASALPLS